jgi:class 3 adenylate cyclase
MAATRRLAAILAADVVGYSRLIGADEPDTLQRLKAIRAGLIDPAVERHNGRIVKTTGDGLLIEFASTVDALRCATEVQAAMAERHAAAAPDNRIEFCIGIPPGRRGNICSAQLPALRKRVGGSATRPSRVPRL